MNASRMDGYLTTMTTSSGTCVNASAPEGLSAKKASFLVLAGLALALAIPFLIRMAPLPNRTHTVTLEAAKYGYTPARIIVNKGDTVILKPTATDVTHGFYLDDYPVEVVIKQQGIAFQKTTWEDEDGHTHTDWDKVPQIEFVAEKAGKFTFRCTQVCGSLHPFMTGELIVRPNTPYHLGVSLSVWVVVSLLLWIRQGYRIRSAARGPVDLLKTVPGLKWIVTRRSFQFALLFPGVAIFYLFIISSLWGSPVGNRNVAIIVVWILWWFALKAIFVPLGARLWCLICPLPAPAEWISRKSLTAVHYAGKPLRGLHHRFFGRQRDWPKPFRNMWLQNVIFLCMISFGIILITRPLATAILFLSILAATFGLVFFFRQRVFCLYLCPVGGFLGNYSMASVTAVRVVDPDVCRRHKDKCCLSGAPEGWACPWNQYVGRMNRNNHCGCCTECIKSCPKDNVSLFLRPFGSDRSLKGYDEMYNVIIMLVVAIAFSITMLGPWGIVKQAANVTESMRMMPFLTYLVLLWGAALVVFPGLFMLAAKGAGCLVGGGVDTRKLTLGLAYILIPVGIFAWIAFSLPPVMINYHYILVVLSDPLGLGWDLFGTATAGFSPLVPEWIPSIQGGVLLVGLYFGIHRGFLSLEKLLPDPKTRTKALLLPSLFALAAVNLLLKLYMG